MIGHLLVEKKVQELVEKKLQEFAGVIADAMENISARLKAIEEELKEIRESKRVATPDRDQEG